MRSSRQIEQLQRPVWGEYLRFEEEYRGRVMDGNPLLEEVGAWLDRHPGKRLRPLLVLLAAKASGRLTVSPDTGCGKHILLAAAMELLHNASLMHDDVVDESDARRGAASVRGHWGNQVAVLCGDWYLAQAMQLMQEAGSAEASAIVARTVQEMSRGELLQLAVAGKRQIGLDEYLQVIGGKTASLLATCCELGGVDRAFGYHYGIVFQLRDDMGSLNAAHDVALPKGVDAEALIERHTRLALDALLPYPPSEALDAMRSLLLPSAPGPS